jgi:hypothetical protein
MVIKTYTIAFLRLKKETYSLLKLTTSAVFYWLVEAEVLETWQWTELKRLFRCLLNLSSTSCNVLTIINVNLDFSIDICLKRFQYTVFPTNGVRDFAGNLFYTFPNRNGYIFPSHVEREL